jgi:hypothetical protein
MKITLELKAAELKALRRALWNLYADELARNPFRTRKSGIAKSCEALMDKIEDATAKGLKR